MATAVSTKLQTLLTKTRELRKASIPPYDCDDCGFTRCKLHEKICDDYSWHCVGEVMKGKKNIVDGHKALCARLANRIASNYERSNFATSEHLAIWIENSLRHVWELSRQTEEERIEGIISARSPAKENGEGEK